MTEATGSAPRRIHRAWLQRGDALWREIVRSREPADAVAADFFRAHREIGRRDRAAISDLVYALLRRHRFVDAALLRMDGAPELAVLAAGLDAGLLCPEQVPWEAVRAARLPGALSALRAELRAETSAGGERAQAALAVQYSLPDWFVARLVARFGVAACEVLLPALRSPAPLAIRVSDRAGVGAIRAGLASQGIEAEPTTHAPRGLRVQRGASLQRQDDFLAGRFEVQDEASQLVGLACEVRLGDLVVDLCAGGGGKTLQLAERVGDEGRVIAVDIDARRLAATRERLSRAGLESRVEFRVADAASADFAGDLRRGADVVLVDAPCTGSGTLRRHPERSLRMEETELPRFAALQRCLIESGAALVRPGGSLVYATCSVLAEENEGVVRAWLPGDGTWREIAVVPPARIAQRGGGPGGCLLPPDIDGDGFFVARFRRGSDSGESE